MVLYWHETVTRNRQEELALLLNWRNCRRSERGARTSGQRFVTYKTTPPLLSLEVIEVCSGGTLVETTYRIAKTGARTYSSEQSIGTWKDSKICDGNQVAISSLHEFPKPLPYVHHEQQAPTLAATV